MSVKEQNWITGPEFGAELRRLIREGASDEDPQMVELYRRVNERDDYLFNRYGKHLRSENEGRWVAISFEGEVILGDSLGEVIHAADERWGSGNAALRKLADSPGLQLLTP
jgi:hypothetical protein